MVVEVEAIDDIEGVAASMNKMTSLEFLRLDGVNVVVEHAAIDSNDFLRSAMVNELDLEAGLPNMCCFGAPTAASIALNSEIDVFLKESSVLLLRLFLILARLSQAIGT